MAAHDSPLLGDADAGELAGSPQITEPCIPAFYTAPVENERHVACRRFGRTVETPRERSYSIKVTERRPEESIFLQQVSVFPFSVRTSFLSNTHKGSLSGARVLSEPCGRGTCPSRKNLAWQSLIPHFICSRMYALSELLLWLVQFGGTDTAHQRKGAGHKG